METTRDLACPELWQQSLERSLARRGRPTRSSLELFSLRPERDLVYGDFVRDSLVYSQLRRSAASRRPAMALPGAGGISALALLAATTLPGLLGGRGAGATGRSRVAYRVRTSAPPRPTRTVESLAVAPTVAAATSSVDELRTPVNAVTSTTLTHAIAAPAHPVAPRTHARTTTRPHHETVAHIAAADDVRAGASGGAAPAAATVSRPTHHMATVVRHLASPPADRHLAAPSAHTPTPSVPRVPAHPQPSGHPSTGGGAIEAPSAPKASAPTTPQAPAHPQPVEHPHPVATSKPAPKPAPTPAPPPASGSYVNPLAQASVSAERIDQGVDYSGSGTLTAIGDGKVTYVGTSGTGWPGAFIEFQLSDGADAGRYVYYAESISPSPGLHVGEVVRAGQPIAQINGGIEIGWGSGVGTQPLAQADGHWSGGDDSSNVASPEGKDFSALIARLGGPAGKVEG